MSRPTPHTLGEFREITASLPDSTPILGWRFDRDGESSIDTISEARIRMVVPVDRDGEFRVMADDDTKENIIQAIVL